MVVPKWSFSNSVILSTFVPSLSCKKELFPSLILCVCVSPSFNIMDHEFFLRSVDYSPLLSLFLWMLKRLQIWLAAAPFCDLLIGLHYSVSTSTWLHFRTSVSTVLMERE